MKQLAKIFFAAWIALAFAMPTFAHGVRIDHTINAATGEITITAAFDTGEILDNAAVVIFAPNDLINPWRTDAMDENGSYTFTPDYTIEGFWDIQVRKAGHGGLINIEITEAMMPEASPDNPEQLTDASSSTVTLIDGSEVVITGNTTFTVSGNSIVFDTPTGVEAPVSAQAAPPTTTTISSGFSTSQIIIMSISVIWGFIGTALYFAGRRSAPAK